MVPQALPSFLFLLLIASLPACLRAEIIDRLLLGDPASGRIHQLTASRSDIVQGALGQTARRLLPLPAASWEGGEITFRMKVDPTAQNYFTVRLWGGDVSQESHVLTVEGKQIGYRHLGDVELLDHGSEEPGYAGRFYYRTCPLPLTLTKGKAEIACSVKLNGRIWGYGSSFDQYQKPVNEPGRGLYGFYTHTDGWFEPPAEEVQGAAPAVAPVRQSHGPEVLEDIKKRVGSELEKALRDKKPWSQMTTHFLAKAWHTDWTPAFHQPAAVDGVVRAVDELWRRHLADPKLVQGDPSVYNKEWFAYGMAGDAVRLLAEPLHDRLAEEIDNGQGVRLPRALAWAEMFAAGRDHLRRNRRLYTNQTMIVDMNIYRQHRAVAILQPVLALPEAKALRYLHEAIGLEPWLGSETENGPAKPQGDNYYQLTRKGLTRELGYVGSYGEVLDWVAQIYETTQDPGKAGDPRIAAQMEKIVRARGYFRYPLPDADGFRAMRLETVVGWRDVHFPGEITYGGRNAWDAISLCSTGVSSDPWTTGYAQQSLEDGQFFPNLADHLKERGYRTTIGLLDAPELYQNLLAQPQSPQRLPMTPGQPDFAWADEENGVVAIKHGDEILYISLYWRARHAVNFLARVHHLTPQLSRIAVVKEDVQFQDSGLKWKRPNWTNFGFANGGMHYPVKLQSAHAGEELTIAAGPYGPDFKPGKESLDAGRGQFYHLRYGPWLIAMNASPDKTFDLPPPPGAPAVSHDLISGKATTLTSPVAVPPLTTRVFRLPD